MVLLKIRYMLTHCSALAHPQPAQVCSQVLVVAQVWLAVDTWEVLFLVVDLLVDPALLLVTSAVDLTTLREIVCILPEED